MHNIIRECFIWVGLYILYIIIQLIQTFQNENLKIVPNKKLSFIWTLIETKT